MGLPRLAQMKAGGTAGDNLCIIRAMPVPDEITRSAEHDIRILWKDGHESIYPARYLRLKCPCAGCVDEWTGKRSLKGDDISEDVVPESLELVGRYGLRIFWRGGHSDGIYTLQLLREL